MSTVLEPVGVGAYTNDAKPYDVIARPFHRINSPHYDRAVDPGAPAGVAPMPRPPGTARESGARGPEDFVHTGLAQKIAEKLVDAAETLLLMVPGLNVVIGVTKMISAAVAKLTDVDYYEEGKKELAKWAAKTVE